MMRPIFACVLLLSACGDNVAPDVIGLPDEEATDPTEPDVPGTMIEARVLPSVCDTRAFPQFQPGLDVELAATAIPTGTAVFAVPRFGGAVTAIAFDGRGRALTDKAGTQVMDGDYRAIAASFVDERLITSAVSSSNEVAFDMHRFDLGDRVRLGSAPGVFVADQAMLPTLEGRVAPYVGTDAIGAVRFDGNWRPDAGASVARGNPISLAATSFPDDVAVVWSTEDSCHVQMLGGEGADFEYARGFSCLGARIAIDEKFLTGHIVFERDGQIMRAPVSVDTSVRMDEAVVLADEGYAPRLVWDGTRYWVSYLDARGFPVVGFLDEANHLQTLGLQALRPMDEAQELIVANGQVWLYTVDRFGLIGARVCALPALPATPPRG